MLKPFNPFSFLVLLGFLLSGKGALAASTEKIHLIENLTQHEARIAQRFIEKKGYRISKEPLFHESRNTILITKALETENDPASIQIEILTKENHHSIPHPVFQIKLETQNLVEVLERIPSPNQISSIPIAFQGRTSR